MLHAILLLHSVPCEFRFTTNLPFPHQTRIMSFNLRPAHRSIMVCLLLPPNRSYYYLPMNGPVPCSSMNSQLSDSLFPTQPTFVSRQTSESIAHPVSYPPDIFYPQCMVTQWWHNTPNSLFQFSHSTLIFWTWSSLVYQRSGIFTSSIALGHKLGLSPHLPTNYSAPRLCSTN